MLDVLQNIVQQVNRARNLDDVLAIAAREVRLAMKVDVASIYLTDFDQKQHVLMLTDGLEIEDPGAIRLEQGEGLVGLVARRAEPVNLSDGSKHPRYKLFKGIGAEQFHAFLGVPIIYQRKVLGVLVVQSSSKKAFVEDNVAFLVTLAAQLSGAIAHAEARGHGSSVEKIKSRGHELFIQAVAGAPGVGIGTALVVFPGTDLNAVPDRVISDIESEVKAYLQALEKVRADIADMKQRLKKHVSEENQVLFDAYALLVDSDSISNHTIALIREGNWAPGALRIVIQENARKFDAFEDAYLRERGDDIREIGRRILQVLLDTGISKREYHKKTILVGDRLGATDLAEVPVKNIAAVISRQGSSSSHVAILARAMGIPTVMGADDLDIGSMDGHHVVVDGYLGRLYVDPSPLVISEYEKLRKEEDKLDRELKGLRKLPSETLDGKHIPLYVNTGLVADMGPSRKSGAEGIGLYRTEFPFMIRDHFPGEAEQKRIYRQVLKVFSPRPVTLRTLDVGGDKALPYFPIEEDNPFLGWRGIRITLDHRDIFLTQIRAMLKAASGLDNLYILLPMISDLSELDEAILLIDQAFTELQEEGEEVSWPKIGAMIEVPSAVYQAEEIAQRVDFMSIGTNDLTQYLLAVDRNNARVAKLYDTLHPSVLRAISQVVEAGHKYGRPVGVCGEMAGDPAAAILLLGMGIDSLSMTVAGLPRIKWVIRSFSQRDARVMLTRALQFSSAKATRKFLHSALESAGLGGLIRAGK